jgi:hypothetical protein
MEYTGNASVSSSVTVNTAAFIADSSTTVDDSNTRIGNTADALYKSDPQAFGAAITAAAVAAGVSVTIIAARVTGGDRAIAEASWHNTVNLEILACPAALT